MMINYNDIKDDEFRVLGSKDRSQSTPPEGNPNRPEKQRKNRSKWILPCLVFFGLLLVGAAILLFSGEKGTPEIGIYDTPGLPTPSGKFADRLLGSPADSLSSYTEQVDTIINDVPLTILIPWNAVPELSVGRPDKNDKSIILITQAADIRADNEKILGSFVLKGEPLAWGKSKHGYCAIIDGSMTIEVAEESPLFEKAIDSKGYFFRQFGLVDKGKLVENQQKNKAHRRALCERDGQYFVILSRNAESYHDFAQALVDLHVDNAITLVGSESAYGWHISPDGSFNELGVDVHKYKNESYLMWRKTI